MASIKKLDTCKFKITVSNGYRPDGRKISRAKTVTAPLSVGGRGISQYVAHKAEEFEKQAKIGYCEDGEMAFQEYATRWLERQTKYAPSTLGFYRRSLESVYPMIGSIKMYSPMRRTPTRLFMSWQFTPATVGESCAL